MRSYRDQGQRRRPVGRYPIALALLVPVSLPALAVWKAPGLVLAAAFVLAAAAVILVMQALLDSPELERQCRDAVMVAGRITATVVPVGLFVAACAGMERWYPFRPLLEVPFAQWTLGAVLVDLAGLVLLAASFVYAQAFRARLRDDADEAGRFGIGLAAVVAVFLIGWRQMS